MTMAMNTPKIAGNQEPIQRWRPIRRMAPASMSPAATLSAATGAMKFHWYGSSLFCNSQDISGMHTAPQAEEKALFKEANCVPHGPAPMGHGMRRDPDRVVPDSHSGSSEESRARREAAGRSSRRP